MNPLPEPNIHANPHPQNKSPQRQVSMMPSSNTLTVSRVRANPASSIMKPACMKNTRNAVTRTQTVLIGFTNGGFSGAAGAAAGAAGATGAAGEVAAGAGASSAQILVPL